ncbi:MAG: hypothetical protein V1735_07500 [Nanoarchaeota archaeon]
MFDAYALAYDARWQVFEALLLIGLLIWYELHDAWCQEHHKQSQGKLFIPVIIGLLIAFGVTVYLRVKAVIS